MIVRPYTVTAIDYTAYRDMANEQMTAIREEAFARWPHDLPACASQPRHHQSGGVVLHGLRQRGHRQQAREAVAYVTDEVKKRLPIFGKEILSDGTHVWKRNQ
jgi:molybdopterin synthase catalytic subunit